MGLLTLEATKAYNFCGGSGKHRDVVINAIKLSSVLQLKLCLNIFQNPFKQILFMRTDH